MNTHKKNIFQNLSEVAHIRFLNKPIWKKHWGMGVIFALVLFCIGLEYYFFVVYGIKRIYSHIFYLPIALAALWYGLRGGLIVSTVLALIHILFFIPALNLIDVSRAISFVFIGVTLGIAVKNKVYAEHERQRSYEELKKTQYRLIQIEKMEIVSRLASTIVHEVKNPLAIALEAAGYLARKVDMQDAAISKSMRYLKEAVQRADHIVRNLLDFSKLSQMEPEICDINLLVQNCVAEHQPILERLNIELSEDYHNDLPEIKVDVVKMRQVFLNILLNAVSAMPDGGYLEVKTSYQHGDAICIQIEDTGHGIPKEVLDKIYEPFFTTKKDKGGTGLGLWLVKHFMDLQGGDIILDNRDPAGISVTLIFPL